MKMLNLKLLVIASIIAMLFSSCSYLYKGKTVYRVQPNTGAGTQLYNSESLTLNNTELVNIEDKGSYLVIKFDNATPNFQTNTTHPISLTNLSVTANSDFISKYTGTDMGLYGTNAAYSRTSYFDIRPVFQGLTIPIKLRPKLSSVAVPDSFPSQVETGFNAGFSIGCKLSHNMFRSRKNFLGLNTTRLSFTPGWFLGLGKVDLKKSNTRGPVIGFERSAAMISTGGYAMLGFNNVSFGYSFGWDWATGSGRQGWVYKGQMWHGIIVAFDIIK